MVFYYFNYMSLFYNNNEMLNIFNDIVSFVYWHNNIKTVFVNGHLNELTFKMHLLIIIYILYYLLYKN